jgi:hypothetical protein
MKWMIKAFSAASAAGGQHEAMALDALVNSLHPEEFSQLRELVEKIINADFGYAVPWTKSKAEFRVGIFADEAAVIFTSCGGTQVILSEGGCFSIRDEETYEERPSDHPRVVAATPFLKTQFSDWEEGYAAYPVRRICNNALPSGE